MAAGVETAAETESEKQERLLKLLFDALKCALKKSPTKLEGKEGFVVGDLLVRPQPNRARFAKTLPQHRAARFAPAPRTQGLWQGLCQLSGLPNKPGKFGPMIKVAYGDKTEHFLNASAGNEIKRSKCAARSRSAARLCSSLPRRHARCRGGRPKQRFQAGRRRRGRALRGGSRTDLGRRAARMHACVHACHARKFLSDVLCGRRKD